MISSLLANKEETMDLLVTLDTRMEGKYCISVYSDASSEAVSKIQGLGFNSVEVHSVQGELEEPGVVYASHCLDKHSDIYIFCGLYGSYDEAKRAIGSGCHVLRKIIDEDLRP